MMPVEAVGQSAPEWWTWAFWARDPESLRNLGLIVFGAVGLLLLWSRTRSLRRQADTAEQRHEAQVEADRERRITDNFTRAVEQLGSDKLETRLGAIYALERIARESPTDHWPIMETLTAYVREQTRLPDPDPDYVAAGERRERFTRWPPEDVQAAVTVIGRRRREHDPPGRRLDLRRAELQNADLEGAHLEGADLARARLRGAILTNAHLEGADLWMSDITQKQLDVASKDENTRVRPGLRTGASDDG